MTLIEIIAKALLLIVVLFLAGWFLEDATKFCRNYVTGYLTVRRIRKHYWTQHELEMNRMDDKICCTGINVHHPDAQRYLSLAIAALEMSAALTKDRRAMRKIGELCLDYEYEKLQEHLGTDWLGRKREGFGYYEEDER